MNLRRIFQLVWLQRWPLLATHICAALASLALVAPLVGGALQFGLRFSGQSALTDQDIAMFLLGPAGFVVFILAGSLVLVGVVLEVAAMMWVLAAAAEGRHQWGLAVLRAVAMKVPKLLVFAAHLILRLLALSLPFLAAAAALAYLRLTEHDINYYLSQRPPEFRVTAALIAPILGLGAALLTERLISWSLALPVILFRDVPARQAFGISRNLTKGHRLGLLARFAVWAAVCLAVGALVSAGATGLAHLAEAFGQQGLGRLVTVLGVVLAFWVLLLAAATTLTSAGFAALLLERFGALEDLPLTLPRAPAMVPPARMAQIAVLLVFVVGAAGLFGARLFATLHTTDQIQIIAHRGAAGLRPENTLASVRKAIEDGTDWVEIDVQESADGEVIVIHDSDFMKVAGSPLKVWNATRADLDRLDIGSFFDPAYASERIPLLREVLETAKGKAKVLIELKYYGHDQNLEARVAEIVEATQMQDQIALMSLSPTGVAKMKALRPDWQVGLLAATALGDLTRLKVDFLAVNTGLAKSSFLRHAKHADRPVMVWTVDDAVGMSQMMSRGVAGLITDYPGRAREVIAARAGMSTAERLLVELADLLGLEVTLPVRMADGP